MPPAPHSSAPTSSGIQPLESHWIVAATPTHVSLSCWTAPTQTSVQYNANHPHQQTHACSSIHSNNPITIIHSSVLVVSAALEICRWSPVLLPVLEPAPYPWLAVAHLCPHPAVTKSRA